MPAILGATAATFLEFYSPYRKEWLGKKDDVIVETHEKIKALKVIGIDLTKRNRS